MELSMNIIVIRDHPTCIPFIILLTLTPSCQTCRLMRCLQHFHCITFYVHQSHICNTAWLGYPLGNLHVKSRHKHCSAMYCDACPCRCSVV